MARLQETLEYICTSRVWHLERAMKQSHLKVAYAGWFSGLGSWGAMAGSACLLDTVPVALPFIFCGGCAVFMGSCVMGEWRSSRVGAQNLPKWQERSKALERQFPSLEGLFES